MSKALTETKVLLTDVRLSYAQLFEPKSINGSDPKYSVSLIISKEDTQTLKVVENAIQAAVEAGKQEKFKGSIKGLKLPLRDGDEERDDEAYANAMFLNANSNEKNPPQVVSRFRDPETGKPRLLTEEDVYSGCYANVTVNFYAFNTSGNRGVAVGLGNVQKTKDGERLAGGASAADEFDFEDDVAGDDWMN